MPDDIFEESTYKISATLKEGGVFSATYKGKLDLIYEIDGKVDHTDADLDVNDGVVNKDYKIPKVPDDKENYALKISAKYGDPKDKTRVLADATIWPKKVKVTIKDKKDDSPLKKFPYVVAFDGFFTTNINGNTDDNGVGNEDLKKSAYTIVLKAPWEIVTNKNDPKKREHEIVARNNPIAAFVKPLITDDCWVAATDKGKDKGVRQYVNLTTADNGCDAKGSKVTFEVALKNKPQGMKDEKVYVKVTFSKVSKRNVPKQELVGPMEGLTEKDTGKTFTGHVKLDADGGSAKFAVEMGYAGGETVTVSIGCSEKDPTDATMTFVTWRKLSYQLRFPTVMTTRMTEKTRADNSKYFDVTDSINTFAVKRLGAVFVEYLNVKSHQYANDLPSTASIVTKGFIDETDATNQLFVMDGSCNWIGTAPGFDPATDDQICVTLCDRAVSSTSKPITPTVILTAAVTEKWVDTDANYLYMSKKHTSANDDNLTVGGYTWKADLTGVSATALATHPGASDALGTPRTGPMTDITIEHVTARKKRYTLPAGVDQPGSFVGPVSDTKCPVIIEFGMVGTYGINGNAGGGSQLLCLKDDIPGSCSSTICHELGHAMGMSVMPLTGLNAIPVPPGLDTPKHVDNGGWYYVDVAVGTMANGERVLHKGPHCSKGMPASKKAVEKFDGWSPGSGDSCCIMWGSGGSDDNRKEFCPTCAEILKARDLRNVRAGWNGRTDP